MSQLLEKAFHLRIKQFASNRLQGMTMGAFREVMEIAKKPLTETLTPYGLTRYAPVPSEPGGMLRTKAGEYVRVDDALEYAEVQIQKGFRQGFAEGKSEFSFIDHLTRQAQWSGDTFGPGMRTKGIIDHITKELKEVAADPSDLKEWIDIVILGLDGAWRVGASPQDIIDAMKAKQAKNEGRNWPDWRTADPDKAIEHDRTGEA